MTVWMTQTVACILYKIEFNEEVHEKVKAVLNGPQMRKMTFGEI
jgi:hypothetical protein